MKSFDMDTFSVKSSSSKSSKNPKTKKSRFSLRPSSLRIFRRHTSNPSTPFNRSSSEIETRSVRSISSVYFSHNSQADREISSDEQSNVEQSSTDQLIECPVCMKLMPLSEFPAITTCHHRSCAACLRQYLKIEIMESRVNVSCPECAERFHPTDITSILNDCTLMKKYEEFMIRRHLVTEPDVRWCPAPDCGYAVIATGCASCPKLKCERPGCDTHFCYHCKQNWHPMQTCDAARAERTSTFRSPSISYSHESGSQKGDIKLCPQCGVFIVKMDDGSCNHMICAVCNASFCWLCMKEITDLHYLSPSGCTFWGKKPWSRKKKILWQFLMLIGAPLGLGLACGIAIPAMIIGIPVWVGRKLHVMHYMESNKHKRNIIIAGGVTASIILSPIITSLVVGIVVPVLLGYIYGVVPISLYRSGGCGVSKTDSGGVRFEFDEGDNANNMAVAYQGAADTQSVETTSRIVANPSIGPSIGEMSLQMTNSLSASGSHIDRAGILRDESDRDSASNRALLGASLNGSLSGSAVAGPSGFQTRVEVQADVTTNTVNPKRSSFSSESANFSLDAKSATVSFSDDASTKALAGSICIKDTDSVSAGDTESKVETCQSNQNNSDCGGFRFVYKQLPDQTSFDENCEKSTCLPITPGSPTSNRSVVFAGDAVKYARSKKFSRQNKSIEDRINEHGEHNDVKQSSEKENSVSINVGLSNSKKSNSVIHPEKSCLVNRISQACSRIPFECVLPKQLSLSAPSPSSLPKVDTDKQISNSKSSRVHTASNDSSTSTLNPEEPLIGRHTKVSKPVKQENGISSNNVKSGFSLRKLKSHKNNSK